MTGGEQRVVVLVREREREGEGERDGGESAAVWEWYAGALFG